VYLYKIIPIVVLAALSFCGTLYCNSHVTSKDIETCENLCEPNGGVWLLRRGVNWHEVECQNRIKIRFAASGKETDAR